MTEEHSLIHLPDYNWFQDALNALHLNISCSELHGIMCGYLCAGAAKQGENYLRALLANKKDEESRKAILAMFSVYSISQEQINNFNFEFQLLLPNDEELLTERAKAFSEWCEGFSLGLSMVGIDIDHFYEEEAQDAMQHIAEFAELDYESLDVDEEDEKAFMEVTEYVRVAVIRLHNDLHVNNHDGQTSDTTH